MSHELPGYKDGDQPEVVGLLCQLVSQGKAKLMFEERAKVIECNDQKTLLITPEKRQNVSLKGLVIKYTQYF